MSYSECIYAYPEGLPTVREVRVGGHLLRVHIRTEGDGICLLLDDEVPVFAPIEHQEQIEDAAPQAEQESPLQGPEGEALPGEGGVGGESPLPDAVPEQVEVVEGVGGEAKRDPAPDFPGFLRDVLTRAMAKPKDEARWDKAAAIDSLFYVASAALDDLQLATFHAIDNGDVTEGNLAVKRGDANATVTAEVQWPYFGYENRNLAARFCVEGKLLKVEE